MSILTKVFVFLVLFAAMVKMGMDINLFSHRIDWKQKWVQAENWRVAIERVKNQEIGEKNTHIQNLTTGISLLQREKEQLEESVRAKDETIEAHAKEIMKWQEALKVEQANLERAQHQLKVEMETVRKLQEMYDAEQKRAELAVARAADAEQKLIELQQRLDQGISDLAELEKKIRLLYKDKHNVETSLQAYIDKYGVLTDPVGRRVEGKVLTYSKPMGAVVLNIGKDDGVLEGMSFSIYRPGKFVATAIAKRVDRNLTVADITLMQIEPQPGDECTNRAPMVGK
ncbi:MAG: hypothetical protein A2Z34_04480 [Planctomycetes bacterium RBG_16_59_8]|nr:MAG: hypothetical protein A2Z34_04480 [Planctomycetes bacterium RBG_16_59_8]